MNIVQARCPHCKNTLRIPADWLQKPMRCKHCKKVFQSKPRQPTPTASPPAAAPPAAPPPAAMPAAVSSPATTAAWEQAPVPPAMPPGHYPQPGQVPYPYPPTATPVGAYPATPPVPAAPSFGFDEVDDQEEGLITRPRRPRGRKGGWLVGIAVMTFLFAITGGVLYMVMPTVLKAIREVEEQANVEGKGGERKPKTKDGKLKVRKSDDTNLAKLNPVAAGSLPRRALIISPENYLLLNRTLYFRESQGGQDVNTLVQRLSRGAPMDMSASQVFVLSDSEILHGKGGPPQKSVIEAAIKDYCETSRPQDRILLLWSGHACEIDGKGYLIPVEGDKGDKDACIAVDWVYDQLAKCKARQKVFIFDGFRFPPARGLELPATGAMTEAFDKQLETPPPGVQVWTACVKDQQSIEFEQGSIFQQAFKDTLQELSLGSIVKPSDPLPIEAMVAKVNQQMKKKLAKTGKSDGSEMKDKEAKEEPGLVQVSRLTGKEADGGAEPNPSEPPAKTVAFNIPDRGGAGNKQLDEILSEIRHFPPQKASQAVQLLSLTSAVLPPLPKEAIDEFKTEGVNPLTIKGMGGEDDAAFLMELNQHREKFPLRAAAAEAAHKIEKSMKLQMKEYLANPGGPLDAKVKTAFLAEQKEPGLAILDMEETLDRFKELMEDRDKETSKRWQAHFDLAYARLMARLIYIYEYNNLIAIIRSDALPGLESGDSGWRVNTSAKVQIKESKVKDMAKQVGKAWARLEKEYPGTPWAIIAKREKNISLGLQWVATRD